MEHAPPVPVYGMPETFVMVRCGSLSGDLASINRLYQLGVMMTLRTRVGGSLVAGTILVIGLGASRLEAQQPDGGALYQQYCRSCHGSQGVPTPRMLTLYPKLKSLADSVY